MSFSAETDELANEIIQAEYNNACGKFGEKYHSLHEGYAVLLEEQEKIENELSKLKSKYQILWKGVKEPNTIEFDFLLGVALMNITDLIKELAQVGAALKKIQNTLEVEVNYV